MQRLVSVDRATANALEIEHWSWEVGELFFSLINNSI
jgi:hypothetical protein